MRWRWQAWACTTTALGFHCQYDWPVDVTRDVQEWTGGSRAGCRRGASDVSTEDIVHVLGQFTRWRLRERAGGDGGVQVGRAGVESRIYTID
jgi:hypothetical protein